jgi:tRNA-Thr(GGU) m(6)t(6)A37 methyltransferase TsaA
MSISNRPAGIVQTGHEHRKKGENNSMMEYDIHYKPIGVIHSPFKEVKGTPIQPAGAEGIDGNIEVFPEYAEGLKDLEGFSHIILLYHFHLSGKPSLMVTPYMDSSPRGVFATRSPRRPNAIGISVVRLMRIERNILHIRDIDIVDGTPLLDIKPHVPDFDKTHVARIGWLEDNIQKVSCSKDDGRFAK